METQRSLLRVLADWWDQGQINRRPTQRDPGRGRASRWLPTPGSIVFTLLMIGLLLWAQTAGALPLPGLLNTPDAPSTGTIAYQGRLADASGNPLTAVVNMEFRLYNVATGGIWLWHEPWTGPNAVQVSDGLFNVMLGSLEPIPQAVVTGNNSLWLGITAGTDDEMMPRVQLGSVPFAVQALTVPDGSVTSAKIADGAVATAKFAEASVTSTKMANGAVSAAKLADGSVTNAKIASAAVTTAKIADGAVTQQKAPSLIASATGTNVKIYHGIDSVTSSGSQTILAKTVNLPQPCSVFPKVLVQPFYNHYPIVTATVGGVWDNSRFTVWLSGPTWSDGQIQEFHWFATCW